MIYVFNLVYNINRFIFAVKYNQLYSSTQFNLMEDKILNEKESLELISQMIRNTQQRLKEGNGKPFLIFGYTTIAISMIVYSLLTLTQSNLSHLAWFGIPVIGFVIMYLSKKNEVKYSKTYIDRIVINIWTVIGASVMFVSIAAIFVRIPVMPLLILLLGIATTLTGLTIRFKPVIFCGVFGMASCVLPYVMNGYNQVLMYAICIFVMMVIPGHILHLKSRK